MNDIQPYQFEPEGTRQEEDDLIWLRNYNPHHVTSEHLRVLLPTF